jgi:hypothetical protein
MPVRRRVLSGIALLVTTHRLANASGAGYTVPNASPTVYDHLRLTGLPELFGMARPADPAATDPAGRPPLP